ncbi:MAG: beta-glucosidase family protein, partial [Deltaproteobacteria bacterium]|nr:beta-glucosidase family protein [Deltaproteobacteria bacterium]
MTALAEIRGLAGELIVAGFPGTVLDEETRQALAERRRGGLIHFRRNIESVEQIHALNQELLAATPDDHGLFLAVDQEGGRVIRVPAPAVQL